MRGIAYAACVVAIYAVCGTGAAVCWCGGLALKLKDRLAA
jgi:hypothetical protein